MFVVAVSALALALVGAACLTSGAPTHLSWLLAMVVVAFLAAVGRPQAIGAIQYSASGIVQIAAIPLLGPVGAAVVAAVPIVVDRNEVVKRFFNLSQRVVYVLAGSFVYAALGGEVLDQGERGDLGAEGPRAVRAVDAERVPLRVVQAAQHRRCLRAERVAARGRALLRSASTPSDAAPTSKVGSGRLGCAGRVA